MSQKKTVEEIKSERVELDKKFEGGLPDYLVTYFDEKELEAAKTEHYKEIASYKWQNTKDERIKYKTDQEKEFWENNESEIIKVPKHAPGDMERVFPESPRAIESDEHDLSPADLKVLKLLCKNDLYLFAIRYFPHFLKKPSSRFHKFLYHTLSRDINRYPNGVKWAIAAPRANSKSSIVSCIMPLWCICYQKKKFIIMISDTAGQATDFLYDLKQELLLNEKLQRDFPEACGEGPIWRTEDIITNNSVKLLTLGTGSKVRGRKYGIHRPDLLLLDDCENHAMVKSDVERHKIRYEWFNKEVLFAGGEEGSSTDFFVVGTILGKDSLLNSLLNPQEYPAWKSTRFKAVEKFAENIDLWNEWENLFKDRFNPKRQDDAKAFFEQHKEEMLKGIEVLWPEGDTYYANMVYKSSNPSGFITEKQNSPVDTSKIYISEAELHFEYFQQNKKIADAIQRGAEKGLIYGAIDLSLGKKSRKGDPSCIVTLIRDPETGYIFVIEMDEKVRSVDDQIDAILKKHGEFHYKLFVVETNCFQFVVMKDLQKKSREQGVYIPVQGIDNYQDKKLRFEGIVPFLKDGTLVFDKHKYSYNSSYRTCVEEITTYTGEDDSADHACDAIEMAFRVAQAPRFRMTFLENKKR